MTGQKRFLLATAQALDSELLPQPLAPAGELARPHKRDREVWAGVAGSPAGLVAAKPRSKVFGDAGVERAIAAAEDIDEGHAGL